MGGGRGRIDLGRIHIACGEPIHLDGESDVAEVSWEVIERLRDASAITTYHLEAYLSHYSEDGMDAAALRSVIEERGGKVLESQLHPSADLHPLIAGTLRQQFAHYLDATGVAIERDGPGGRIREREPVA